jgi:hypothetical protein
VESAGTFYKQLIIRGGRYIHNIPREGAVVRSEKSVKPEKAVKPGKWGKRRKWGKMGSLQVYSP